MNFTEDKGQVFGKEQPPATTQAGADQLGSSSAEKELRVSVDTRLTMSQRCVVTANKANSMLGCAKQSLAGRLREGVPPLCSDPVRPPLETVSSCFEPPVQEDESSEGPPRSSGGEAEGTGLVQSGEGLGDVW